MWSRGKKSVVQMGRSQTLMPEAVIYHVTGGRPIMIYNTSSDLVRIGAEVAIIMIRGG